MPQKNMQEFIMTWELTCRQCKSNFELPVPRGPREEKELKCPECGSKEIVRREALSQAAPQCGG
jgi:rRNA maturation endonuclease Nob1